MKPIICMDFDGVIHSYKSGWKGPTVIPDPPVDGAIDWMERFIINNPGMQLCIYSARSKYWGAKKAIKKWLLDNGMRPVILKLIDFPTKKPPATLTIDDRAICFDGNFSTLTNKVARFKPWHEKGV